MPHHKSLIADLDVNLNKWRQDGQELSRDMRPDGSNSSLRIKISPSARIEVAIRGDNNATHTVKLPILQRMAVKRAANRWKAKLLADAFSQLGKVNDGKDTAAPAK